MVGLVTNMALCSCRLSTLGQVGVNYVLYKNMKDKGSEADLTFCCALFSKVIGAKGCIGVARPPSLCVVAATQGQSANR